MRKVVKRFFGSEKVIVKKYQNCEEVILNRPDKLNALDPEIFITLSQKTKKWEENSNPPSLFILKGNGDRAFCAGGDVSSLYHLKKAAQSDSIIPSSSINFFRKGYTMHYDLSTAKPLGVAIWENLVVGGGVGMSVNFPFKIATESTSLSIPEARIGFFVDAGNSWFFSRLENGLGYYLTLTGAFFRGREVKQAGIATHFVPKHNLDKLEEKLKYEMPSGKNELEQAIKAALEETEEKIDEDLPILEIIKK